MGCSASRNTEAHTKTPVKRQMVDGSFGRGHLPSADGQHLVALISSTYGTLELDSQKQADESGSDEVDPLKEVYDRIKAIDENEKSDVAPQAWSEVSNVLINLKNDAHRTTGESGLVNGLHQPEILNTWELEEDVEEDEQFPKSDKDFLTESAIAAPMENPKSGPPRTFATIHTIEELDTMESSMSRLQSTSSCDVLEHHSGVEGDATTDSSSNIKTLPSMLSSYPLSVGNTSPPKQNGNASKGLGKASILKYLSRNKSWEVSSSPGKILRKKLAPQSRVEPSSQNCVGTNLLKPPNLSGSHYWNGEKRTPPKPMCSKSELFDGEFLASIQEAFEKLSEDEWLSVSIEKGNRGSEAILIDSTTPANTTSKDEQNGAQTLASSVVVTPMKDFQHLPATFIGKASAKDPFQQYEVRCPPNGERSVVLYSTSLRGIRKTFADCNAVRTIVQSSGVQFDERDISLHSEFKQELKNLFQKPMAVPRLFIKGWYIGGAEEALKLHETGTLEKLLDGVPLNLSKAACDGCGGVRFITCTDCNGSCRMITEQGKFARCTDCNENGLIKCPICS